MGPEQGWLEANPLCLLEGEEVQTCTWEPTPQEKAPALF